MYVCSIDIFSGSKTIPKTWRVFQLDTNSPLLCELSSLKTYTPENEHDNDGKTHRFLIGDTTSNGCCFISWVCFFGDFSKKVRQMVVNNGDLPWYIESKKSD